MCEYGTAVTLDPLRERELRLPVSAQTQTQPRRHPHLAGIDRARIQRSERAAQPRAHVLCERLTAHMYLDRQLHGEAAQRAVFLGIDDIRRNAALDLCALVRKREIPKAERPLRDHECAEIAERVGHDGVHAARLLLGAVKDPRIHSVLLLAQL